MIAGFFHFRWVVGLPARLPNTKQKEEVMKKHLAGLRLAPAVLLALACDVRAYELYNHDDTVLNADLKAMYAWLTSQESYNGKEGRSTWQEGFVNFGLSGSTRLGGGSAYGGVSAVSSASWGDGDAGGNSTGNERETDWENAFVGWRSGKLLPLLGEDGLDISAGRQDFLVGDAFVIGANSFNPGNAYGERYDRGGAYYLGARKAYDNTAIIRLGGKTGLRADLAWLDSGLAAQSKTQVALANIEHVSDAGTLALLYVRGLDVDHKHAFTPGQTEREGMNLYSLRGTTSAGVENLFLSAEFVTEDKQNAATAGYAEVGYTLAQLPWSPTLTYRYSRFSKNYDAMFNDFSRGFGTWFQGEVAGNYAGPFNSNARIHHVGVKAAPRDDLSLGLLYFDFRSVDTTMADLQARELDFFLEWMPTPNYLIAPTIGLYDPKHSFAEGGAQTADAKPSLYAQVTFGVFF